MLTGISVQEQQGEIDWQAVKEEGIDFVMLGCRIRGKEEETCFEENLQGCVKNNIPMGVYVESRAVSIEQAKQEAEWVLSIIGNRQLQYPLMLFMGDCDTTLQVPMETKGDIAEIFCNIIKTASFQTGIYANKYWFTNLLRDIRFQQWERWVIQNFKECTFSGEYSMWQYTSVAKIKGIQGYVAVSRCRTNKELRRTGIPNLKGYAGTSLVAALNQIEYASDFETRRRLAMEVGVVAEPLEYKGTGQQNIEILRKLGGTVSASKMLREGAYIKIKPGSRNILTGTDFDAVIYDNVFQILRISGVSVVFGVRGRVVGKVNRNGVVVI